MLSAAARGKEHSKYPCKLQHEVINKQKNIGVKLETSVSLQRTWLRGLGSDKGPRWFGKKIPEEERMLDLVPSECWLSMWVGSRQAAGNRQQGLRA